MGTKSQIHSFSSYNTILGAGVHFQFPASTKAPTKLLKNASAPGKISIISH